MRLILTKYYTFIVIYSATILISIEYCLLSIIRIFAFVNRTIDMLFA